MLSEEVAEVALANDATSVRIMSKNVNLSEGEKVGVRLNLNVRKEHRCSCADYTQKVSYWRGP